MAGETSRTGMLSIRLQREAEDTVMTEKLKYFPGLDAASLLSKCVQQICAALPQRSVRASAFQSMHARTAIMHSLTQNWICWTGLAHRFDVNNDGVLDEEEQKALEMADILKGQEAKRLAAEREKEIKRKQ